MEFCQEIHGMKNCLIIDDCPDLTEMLSLYLLEEGCAVWSAETVEEAFSILREESFDIIFCDLHLPFTYGEKMQEYLYNEEVGIRTIGELTWVFPEMPVIAMSSTPDRDATLLRERLGDLPFLHKPFKREDVQAYLDFKVIPQKTPEHLLTLS